MVEPEVRIGGVNVAFKEQVHKILERIKNEPYFRWHGKMGCIGLAQYTHTRTHTHTDIYIYIYIYIKGKRSDV